MIDITTMNASSLYKKLSDKRSAFHQRAKDASKLTIPQLYPDSEETSSVTYSTPYQSLGARGVNNLANKIILSLFPPSTAFFKLDANQIAKKSAGVSDGDLQNAMYIIEKGVINEMEVSQLRSVLVDVIKQGIVGGSAVIHVPENDKPRAFSLAQFGVKRSKSGTVIQLVIKEMVSYLELPKDVRDSLDDITESESKGTKDLELYTLIVRDDEDMYQVVQQIKGVNVEGTEASYKPEELPYVFVPFVDRKEDFGRSYVEDFIGDLQSYEGLRQSVLEAAAESARIIYLVKPNAVLTPRKLQTAKSGDVLQGSADDVATLQADKRLDLQIAQKESDILRQDLGTIFLLDSAVRRDAERVTAEEIRRVAQELEVSLGGIYSTLANVVQEPLVRIYLRRLVKKGMIKDILKDSLELEITTGSAALGRGSEFRALSEFTSASAQLLGPEGMSRFFNMPELLKRMAYSLDVNTGDLVKSQEQLDAEQQAEQQAQLQQQAVSPAINAAAKQQEQQG